EILLCQVEVSRAESPWRLGSALTGRRRLCRCLVLAKRPVVERGGKVFVGGQFPLVMRASSAAGCPLLLEGVGQVVQRSVQICVVGVDIGVAIAGLYVVERVQKGHV